MEQSQFIPPKDYFKYFIDDLDQKFKEQKIKNHKLMILQKKRKIKNIIETKIIPYSISYKQLSKQKQSRDLQQKFYKLKSKQPIQKQSSIHRSKLYSSTQHSSPTLLTKSSKFQSNWKIAFRKDQINQISYKRKKTVSEKFNENLSRTRTPTPRMANLRKVKFGSKTYFQVSSKFTRKN